MSQDSDVKTPQQIAGLKLQDISIQRASYYSETDAWKLSASFSGHSGNVQNLRLNVDGNIANKIMELLAPIIVMEASKEAQRLADQSKTLASSLSDAIIKSIPLPEEPTEAQGME